MLEKNLPLKKSANWIIISFPILFFFTFIFIYAVNLPFRDDYTSVLLFLNNFIDSHHFSDKINLIFQKHYGQIPFFTHIISLFLYQIEGIINFKYMIIIGNLGLLVIFLTLYKDFQLKNDKTLYFLPIAFLFFQPMYSENIYQAMASIGNFYIMSFGLLSLLLLINYKNGLIPFLLAIFFSIMSFLTQANGLIFLFLGIPVLFYQKRVKEGIVWSIFTILSVIFYFFYDLQSGSSINFSILKIPSYLLYFFTFIGNNFGVNENSSIYTQGSGLLQFFLKAVPIAAGILISAYFIFLTITAYYKKNLFLYTILFFLFISAAGAAVTRLDLGMITAVSSRYRVLTILFLIVSYLSLIEIIPEKWKKAVFYSGLCSAVVFCAFSYTLKMKSIQNHREELVQNFKKWKETGTGLGPLAWPVEKGTAESILADSIKRNVYKVPDKLE